MSWQPPHLSQNRENTERGCGGRVGVYGVRVYVFGGSYKSLIVSSVPTCSSYLHLQPFSLLSTPFSLHHLSSCPLSLLSGAPIHPFIQVRQKINMKCCSRKGLFEKTHNKNQSSFRCFGQWQEWAEQKNETRWLLGCVTSRYAAIEWNTFSSCMNNKARMTHVNNIFCSFRLYSRSAFG